MPAAPGLARSGGGTAVAAVDRKMGWISSLRGRVQCRYLMVYRVDPAVAAPLLPEGSSPHVFRGSTLIVLCYTHLVGASSRLLPRWLRGQSDHLAWRIPVVRDGVRGVWIPRRDTSSWVSVRFSGALSQGTYHLARFELEDGEGRLRLRVSAGGEEVLYLAAEHAGELRGSLFSTTRQAHEYLAEAGAVNPPDPLAPALDRLDVGTGNTVEPLLVRELRIPRFEDVGLFPRGSVEFDCCLRLTNARRTDPLRVSELRPLEVPLEGAVPSRG